MYTKLISVETKARFDAIQSGANPIPQTSFVLIKDTNQLWTHGIFINGITATTGSGSLTLTAAGQNYSLALADSYHKKNEDINLGLYTQNTDTLSYVLKAGAHTIAKYEYKGDSNSQTGIHIGTEDDKLLFCTNKSLVRYYRNGNATAYVNILDQGNTKITTSNNIVTYNIGGANNDSYIYYVRQDISGIEPSSNSSNVYSRLGGNDDYGWIVTNKNASSSDKYYYLRFSNESSPKVMLKVPAQNNLVKVMTQNDIFIGSNGSSAGAVGIVPAPPANSGLFLCSDGSWKVPDPNITIASADAAGLIKVAVHSGTVSYNSITSNSGRNYQIEIDSDGKAFVNVPKSVYSLIVGSSSNSTSTISSSQSDPYINFVDSGVVSKSIQLKAGLLTSISSTTEGVITIGNSTQTWTINNINYTVCANNALSSIYAPTVSGDSGDVLVSNGANNAPVWVTLSTLISSIATQEKESYEITKALTTDWVTTGISTSDSTLLGTYVIQIRNTNNDIWSGMFSWGEVASSAVVDEEILLHSLNSGTTDIFIKVVSTASTTHCTLYIAATSSISSTKYNIILRKLC